MKKLMMMAVAVLFAASANAQGDIVKLIKKAKTYSDAMQLVNQGVSALSNEDKAKVYTKVCDLAAKEFSTEQDNYIKKDLNPGGYDVNNAYTAAHRFCRISDFMLTLQMLCMTAKSIWTPTFHRFLISQHGALLSSTMQKT